MNPLVRLVDDDNDFRSSQELFLGMCGFDTIGYSSAAAFLDDMRPERPGCLVLDIRMPGLTGIDLQRILKERGVEIPIIFLTGHGTVETAVQTLKIGASDFIEKQGDPMRLREAVQKACDASVAASKERTDTEKRRRTFDALTPREKDVVLLAARGLTNKVIAEHLGIGVETVKMHRANGFGKLGVQSALDAYRWITALDPALFPDETEA